MLTKADFDGWRFRRDAVHFNGGREFFGWGHRCIDQPRLLVIDKYFKRDRSTQRSYLVDGRVTFPTLEGALEALSVPPAVSADDRRLLEILANQGDADGWARPELRAPYLGLADMGFVEWGRTAANEVTCRLTDAGRTAIATLERLQKETPS